VKTYTEIYRNISEQSVGWKKVARADLVFQNNVYGSADGLVVIKSAEEEPGGNFWAELLEPIHNKVKKGDIFAYTHDELYVGTADKWKDWDLAGLEDYILGGVKHKKTDDIKLHPVAENYELFEKYLDDEEIQSLIQKAKQGAAAVKADPKKSKVERDQAKEVLAWISSVAKTWQREKSLHPNAVNGLMRIVAGTQSSSWKGWGFRTLGWKASPDGKVPADYKNEMREQILDERRAGMTSAALKVGALATKRWIIQKGREGKVSSQINGLAALVLLSLAATDDGKSFMSKAIAVSGFMKE
jgi:hypothetical protein